MLNRTTLKRHARLVDEVAGKLGLDLEDSALSGNLSIGAIEDAVLRCANCSDPGGCERWLASTTGMADEAPDFCRNTELFHELKTV